MVAVENKAVLVVIDGYGIPSESSPKEENAIAAAKTPPAIVGVATTNKAIGEIYKTCKKECYILFITSDHGNVDEIKFPDGKPKTLHTTNKVSFIMANAPKGWSLAQTTEVIPGNVAPTILEAMGLKQLEEMTGRSLLVKS